MPIKKTYLNIQALLKRLKIKEGDYIGDLGCGSGYFTIPSARAVGASGRIFAMDVQKTVIENIKVRARMDNLGNIVAVWTNLEIYGATKSVNDANLDHTLLVNIFFQTKKYLEIMKEAVRMTKPKGNILVIDWKNEKTPFGPMLEDRVDPEIIKKVAKRFGLTLDREFEAGEYHWGLLFKK